MDKVPQGRRSTVGAGRLGRKGVQGRACAFERGSVLPALTWDSLSFVSCSEKGPYEGAGVPSIPRCCQARLCQGAAGDGHETPPAWWEECPLSAGGQAELKGRPSGHLKGGGSVCAEGRRREESEPGSGSLGRGRRPGRLCLELMLLPLA